MSIDKKAIQEEVTKRIKEEGLSEELIGAFLYECKENHDKLDCTYEFLKSYILVEYANKKIEKRDKEDYLAKANSCRACFD